MTDLRVSVDAATTPERIWAVATDWAGQGRWIPLTTTKVTDQRADGAPTRLDAWTGIGPVGFHDLMNVRVWEPPHRLVLDHVGRVVRGSAGFDIVPVTPQLSRITWWEEFDPPLGVVGRMAVRLGAPLLRMTLRSSVRKLVRLAESGA